MRYLCSVCYCGKNFSGWQSQKKGEITIQGEIEKALKIILKNDIKIVGSGRTDSGVNAFSQKFHFDTDIAFDKNKLISSLNAILPEDIKLTDIITTSLDARFSAKKKTYLYRIYLSKFKFPNIYGRLQVYKDFDIKSLKKACKILSGKHDFKNFMAAGSSVKDTVRILYSIKLKKYTFANTTFIDIYFCGNGFLYKMVRNMVGLMLELATKKLDLETFKNLAFKNNKQKFTAPGENLYLYDVKYK